MFPVYPIAVPYQKGPHLSGTVKRRPGILLVNLAHEQQIVLIYHRFIVNAGPGDVQKFRLMADGNFSIRLVNEQQLIPMG